MDTLKDRLVQARKKLGISQQEVANRCGWEYHSRIANYEAGLEPENLDAIERLAHALDETPGWLAFGEDPGVKLSAEERALLDNFRRADDAYRAAAIALLSTAVATPPPPPPPPSDDSNPVVLKSITKLEPNNREPEGRKPCS